MKWYLYDYFIERPEPTRYRYWAVGGEDQAIPQYIKSLEVEINDEMGGIDSAAQLRWANDDYIGGLKVDPMSGRACMFRVYLGGTSGAADDWRAGRWVLLVLEFDLVPVDVVKGLNIECFAGYRVESARLAPLPVYFPTLELEQVKQGSVDLPTKADVSIERARDHSISMTSGSGIKGLLLLRKLHGGFQGTLRCKKPVFETTPNPPLPPEKSQSVSENPPESSGMPRRVFLLAARNVHHVLWAVVTITFMLLAWKHGHKRASNRDIDEEVVMRSEVISIAGPEPGKTTTVKVSGGIEFSFKALDSKSTLFELHQQKRNTLPTRRPQPSDEQIKTPKPDE